MIQWILLSLLFSIIVEWAGMVLWWPEEGTEHTAAPCSPRRSAIRVRTSDAVSSHLTRHSLPNALPINTYHYLFEVTRFRRFHPLGPPPPAAMRMIQPC